jgi:hypothetical protein
MGFNLEGKTMKFKLKNVTKFCLGDNDWRPKKSFLNLGLLRDSNP